MVNQVKSLMTKKQFEIEFLGRIFIISNSMDVVRLLRIRDRWLKRKGEEKSIKSNEQEE